MSSPLLRHRAVPHQHTGNQSPPSTLQYASGSTEGDNHSLAGHISAGHKTSRYTSVFGTNGPQRLSSRRSLFDETYTSSSSLLGGWRQKIVLTVGVLLLAAPWIRHSTMLWKVRTLQQELSVLQKDQRRLQSRLGMQTDTLKRVKTDIREHQKKNDVLLGDLKTHGDTFEDFDSKHYEEAEAIENEYFQRVETLESEIQRSSERKLVRNGYAMLGNTQPIRVEITLNQDVSTFGKTIVMELGPIRFLGHAIELFLMLVEQKNFYDHLTLMHRTAGSSVISTVPMDSDTMQIVSNNFVRGGHPIIGIPASDESTSADLKIEDEFMLQQVAMLEQADNYPVQKYSVLFADKGPQFYIVMDDKRARKEGDIQDTCFGRIVAGQAILDFMTSHHERNFRGMSMVGIESVRVLKPVADPVADPRLFPTAQTTPPSKNGAKRRSMMVSSSSSSSSASSGANERTKIKPL